MTKLQVASYKLQVRCYDKNHKGSNVRHLVLGLLGLFVIWNLLLGIFPLYAQDSAKVDYLRQQILEAKSKEGSYAAFEEAADLYFSAHKYNEFVSFLDSLAKEKKELAPAADYYSALCRYYQLKHLEEIQNWDEYFANGNTYRDAVVNLAQNAVDATSSGESLNLFAKLILWKFHKDQQDVLAEDSLTALFACALEYAKNNTNLMPLKAVADELAAYGERQKSKELYKVYLDKFLSSGAKDEELLSTASAFYKEENLGLAEMVYDQYIERITKTYPKDKLAATLVNIAGQFAYRDSGPCDPLYAENIFNKAEAAGGKDVFDEELMYLRANSLEKAKAYPEAGNLYIDLASRFPYGARADKADFKVGIIYTYILRDIKNGRAYFQELAAKKNLNAPAASALYQLGLLSQWEGDNAKAKDYYSRLINSANGAFGHSVTLAKERMKEIEEAKPIEYNLQSFLDASFREENAAFDMSKIDLRPAPSTAGKNQEINISSVVYTAESGCMQVEIQYLWSGDLGPAMPASSQALFSTRYSDEGTYVVGLLAVSPSGIIDRGVSIIDVE